MSLESFYGGATVFLVTFYRVLSSLFFVCVDSALIVSVKLESTEMLLNKCRPVNIFIVQNFSPLKLDLICLWPLKVLI